MDAGLRSGLTRTLSPSEKRRKKWQISKKKTGKKSLQDFSTAQSLDEEGVHVWPISTRTRIFLPYFSWETDSIDSLTSTDAIIGSGKFSKVYRVNKDFSSKQRVSKPGHKSIRSFSVDDTYNRSYDLTDHAEEVVTQTLDVARKSDSNEEEALAIKVMEKSVVLGQAGLASQLNQETRIHSVCRNHPNILNMMRAWQDERHLYMAFELCPRGTLRDVIAGRQVSDKEISERAVLAAARQMTSALVYVHDIGVMHRDVKPENVLVSGSGKRLLLTDFGLALWLGRREKTTSICGTLPYMAPEVLSASPSQPYGHSADFWSLGVTLYWMRRGRLPFPCNSGSDHHHMLQSLTDNYPAVMAELTGDGTSDVSSVLHALLEFDGMARDGRRLVHSTQDHGSQESFIDLL